MSIGIYISSTKNHARSTRFRSEHLFDFGSRAFGPQQTGEKTRSHHFYQAVARQRLVRSKDAEAQTVQ